MQHYTFPTTHGVVTGKENNPDLFMRAVYFDAGYSEASYHSHPNSYEFYLVLFGSLIFENDKGERQIAVQNSLVYFDENEPHKIVAVTESTTMLLIKRIGSEKRTSE